MLDGDGLCEELSLAEIDPLGETLGVVVYDTLGEELPDVPDKVLGVALDVMLWDREIDAEALETPKRIIQGVARVRENMPELVEDTKSCTEAPKPVVTRVFSQARAFVDVPGAGHQNAPMRERGKYGAQP